MTKYFMPEGRKELVFEAKMIKVDMYVYKFNTNKTDLNEGNKIWTKKLFRHYLPAIDKKILKEFFEQYNLPDLEKPRNIIINSFNLIPVIDITIIILFLSIIFRIFKS
jgi:hypothetical protein